MKRILAIFLFPVFGFAQDYSFNSADISGALTAASLTVDNVAVDNATIGHSSDTDLLTKLISINPKRYTMNNDADQKEKIGLLAQDVQAVFPELVDENNEYMSVNYQALIPILISAVNEQTKRNESLKQRIETLKSKIQ